MSVVTATKTRRRLPVPRPRWILVTVVLLLFASILLVNSLVRGAFTQDGAVSSTNDTGQVPAAALSGGPIFRPPYSSTVKALDNKTWSVMAAMGKRGYRTVINNLDSRDWEAATTVADIVKAVTPADDAGAILLFHDGGGNRAKTATALATVIPTLKNAGYTFTTVAKLTGETTVNPVAGGKDRALGRGLVGAIRLANAVTDAFAWLLLVLGVLTVARLFFLNPLETLAAWAAMLAVQLASTIYAFRLDKESLRPLWRLPLQQFVYRQVMYLVLIQSVLAALGGIRLGWQKLRRTGGLNALIGTKLPTGDA